jgi:hypothetical protein
MNPENPENIAIVNGIKFDIGQVKKYLPVLHSMIDKPPHKRGSTGEFVVSLGNEKDEYVGFAAQYLKDPEHFVPVGSCEVGQSARDALEFFGAEKHASIKSTYELLSGLTHTQINILQDGGEQSWFLIPLNLSSHRTTFQDCIDKALKDVEDAALVRLVKKRLRQVTTDHVRYDDLFDIIKISTRNEWPEKYHHEDLEWLVVLLSELSDDDNGGVRMIRSQDEVEPIVNIGTYIDKIIEINHDVRPDFDLDDDESADQDDE